MAQMRGKILQSSSRFIREVPSVDLKRRFGAVGRDRISHRLLPFVYLRLIDKRASADYLLQTTFYVSFISVRHGRFGFPIASYPVFCYECD